MAELCPCGTKQDFNQCCEPIIKDSTNAETAEQLMRARFTAYVHKNMDFVYDTHDPSTRSDTDMEANRQWAETADFRNLKIVDTEDGTSDDVRGIVEFKATYTQDEEEVEHHERSTFVKKKGRWFFSKGRDPSVGTIVNEGPKVGRNDPCVCGSGKKFKKCCGK